MKRFEGPLVLAALATVGLGLALGLRPFGPRLAVELWLLVLGALGLLAATLAVQDAAAAQGPSQLERALRRRPPQPGRPHQLEKLEREVVLGAGSSFDLHYRLRPLLYRIADQRLDGRSAAETLAPETWTLLDPDRPPPRDRHAVGIPLAALRTIVDDLERL